MKHKLIVLEGIDGVGKTSLAKALVSRMEADGRTAIYSSGIYPPYDNCKNDIRTKVSATAHYYFFLSAMVHTSEIFSEMTKYQTVVCDRYFYSTQAYHAARGVDVVAIDKVTMKPADILVQVTISDEKLRMSRIFSRMDNFPEDLIRRGEDSIVDQIEKKLDGFGMEKFENDIIGVNESSELLYLRIKSRL